MEIRAEMKRAPECLAAIGALDETNYEEGIEMKSITGNNTTQSGNGLTFEQRQLLSHFNSMGDEARRCTLGMIASIAAGEAARSSRPKLRVVAGGAA